MNFCQRLLEIGLVHDEHFQGFLGNSLFIKVQIGKHTAQRRQRGLARQARYIGTGIAMGIGRDLLQLHLFTQGHAAGMNLENLQPALLIRNPHLDLSVKASGPPQCLVDAIQPVRGADDDDVLPRL